MRELTDMELDAVSGGILNFFTVQVNSNGTLQSNIAGIQVAGFGQNNQNGTTQINA
jgi:hypothetical protein